MANLEDTLKANKKFRQENFGRVAELSEFENGHGYKIWKYFPNDVESKGCIASVVGGYGVMGYREDYLPKWYFVLAQKEKFHVATIVYSVLQAKSVDREVQINQTIQALQKLQPQIVVGDSYGGGLLFDICALGRYPAKDAAYPDPLFIYHSPTWEWHSDKVAEASKRFQTKKAAEEYMVGGTDEFDGSRGLAAVRLNVGIPRNKKLTTGKNVLLLSKGDTVVENPTEKNPICLMSARVYTFQNTPGHSVSIGADHQKVTDILHECFISKRATFDTTWEKV